MSIGAKLISEERLRQKEAKGPPPEHDDAQRNGELISASACYLSAAQTALIRDDATYYHVQPPFNQGPAHWPWDWNWWEPSDYSTKNLVKAGALIAAEIDRLIRDNALKEEPELACMDCATERGARIPPDHRPSFYEGICGLCGETKEVTQTRDFGITRNLLRG